MKDEKFPTFPTLPGEIKEEESRYTFRANNYEEALSRMILDCLKKPQSELSAQKLGVHAATNFRQMATARLESGERFELAITGNFEPPLPVKDRPSNVECSVLDFTERGREVADALIKTARTMMDEANAGNVPPAFILYTAAFASRKPAIISNSVLLAARLQSFRASHKTTLRPDELFNFLEI
jgi:hypothetical protein